MSKNTQSGKRSGLTSGLAMIGITCVIGFAAANIYIDSKEMREKEQTYKLREEALERQLEEEALRTDALEERKIYVTTDKYIEEVARDRLGLLNPDEVLIKAKEE